MTHTENNKKKTRSSILYSELIAKVDEYEKLRRSDSNWQFPEGSRVYNPVGRPVSPSSQLFTLVLSSLYAQPLHKVLSCYLAFSADPDTASCPWKGHVLPLNYENISGVACRIRTELAQRERLLTLPKVQCDIILVCPEGFEPPTYCLAYHYSFRYRFNVLWSGLYLHLF